VVSSDDESESFSFPRILPKDKSVVTWLPFYDGPLHHFNII
jgi:hypothetical protein